MATLKRYASFAYYAAWGKVLLQLVMLVRLEINLALQIKNQKEWRGSECDGCEWDLWNRNHSRLPSLWSLYEVVDKTVGLCESKKKNKLKLKFKFKFKLQLHCKFCYVSCIVVLENVKMKTVSESCAVLKGVAAKWYKEVGIDDLGIISDYYSVFLRV